MIENRSVPANAILPHVTEELHETAYGELQYGVKDLDGHQWLFSEDVRDGQRSRHGMLRLRHR